MIRFAKTVLSTFILVALSSFSAWADSISVDEARDVAFRFVKSGQQTRRLPGKKAALGDERLDLVEMENVHSCYIFNHTSANGEAMGFLIVAADDDCSRQVLAYSTDGSFDAKNMAPAVKEWIEEIEQSTVNRQQSPKVKTGAKPKMQDNAPGNIVVAPLLTTQWGQTYPFNMLCPTKDDERCVTGCVATAMAQVMNYYKWPEKGKERISYYDDFGCKQDVSVDFSESTYDWANMTDMYFTWKGTDAEYKAVSTLMRDCGASIQMYYTPEGSGASMGMVPKALKSYFSYAPTTTAIYRNNFSDEDWETMIREELDQKRPLIYAGSQEASGHAFICDGYDDAGYVHFNFGWNGANDGWYLTTVNVGYAHNQCMIYGCTPDREGTSEQETQEQDEFSWTLTEDGTLTILGKGQMPADYTNTTAPWLQPEDDTAEALSRARSKVVKVIVGKGITNLNESLFRNYGRLKKVMLPEGLISIDYYCFGFSTLEEINLPSTLVSIGSYAFCHTKLQTVILPAATTTVGQGAFTGCEMIGAYEVEPDNKALRSIEGVLYNRKGTTLMSVPSSRDEYVLPDGVEYLMAYSIGGTNLTSFEVPDGVVLDGEVFRNSQKLESLRLPSELTEITHGLCMYCYALKDCPIPEGVTVIQNYGFQDCAFSSVTLPAGLEVIRSMAYDGCTQLGEIRCKAKVAPKLDGNFIFRRLPTGGSLVVPTGSDYSTWLDLLPPGWTVQYTDDFNDESEDSKWTYDESTGTLTISGKGRMTFDSKNRPWQGYDIRHVVVEEGIVNIPYNLFMMNSDLESVILPESLSSIEWGAFRSCFSLQSIVLPKNLAVLGEMAFASCLNLSSITCLAPNAPDITAGQVFVNLPEGGVLTVPEGSNYSTWLEALPTGWTIASGGGQDDPLIGTVLYVLGCDSKWDPSQASATLSYNPNTKRYVGDIVVMGVDGGYGYFCIGKKLGNDSSDWGTFNDNRLGAPAVDYPIFSEETCSLYLGFDSSFKAKEGTHHLSVDLAAMTLDFDCPDGVRLVKEDLQEPIFDLQGRRLSQKPTRGIYIQNGKKVLVK